MKRTVQNVTNASIFHLWALLYVVCEFVVDICSAVALGEVCAFLEVVGVIVSAEVSNMFMYCKILTENMY